MTPAGGKSLPAWKGGRSSGVICDQRRPVLSCSLIAPCPRCQTLAGAAWVCTERMGEPALTSPEAAGSTDANFFPLSTITGVINE